MLKILISLVFAVGICFFIFESRSFEKTIKINGISLVAQRDSVSQVSFSKLEAINPNFVAIIPYAFTRKSEANVVFNHSRQWFGERPEGVAQQISLSKNANYKTMLKPHIWVGGDGWPGDLRFSNGEWENWEKDYREYILTYAKIADSMNVDLFCIGTEVRKSAAERTYFWVELIRDVRDVYHGPLTYAANWDNFENVKFWGELDFVGIDAYFPLDTSAAPTRESLEKAWEEPRQKILRLSEEVNKPVLFTEFGYRSIKGAAGEHWKITDPVFDEQCQSICYEAIFSTFWDETWFAGGFLWKWHFREGAGGKGHQGFTPQGKMASEVIRMQYANSTD